MPQRFHEMMETGLMEGVLLVTNSFTESFAHQLSHSFSNTERLL